MVLVAESTFLIVPWTALTTSCAAYAAETSDSARTALPIIFMFYELLLFRLTSGSQTHLTLSMRAQRSVSATRRLSATMSTIGDHSRVPLGSRSIPCESTHPYLDWVLGSFICGRSLLGGVGLRERDFQCSVLQRGSHLIEIDILREINHAEDFIAPPLTVNSLPLLLIMDLFPLSADDETMRFNSYLNILLFEARHISSDDHLIVGFADLGRHWVQ